MTEPENDAGERRPVVPVGGGVPFDPETGKRYGYLPRKAASRKLVIRAQLGLPWVLGALGTALVVLLVGAVWLASRPDRLDPPWVDVGPVDHYAEGEVTPLPDRRGWLDRRSGLVAVAEPVDHCPADGGWADAAGRRYDERGRAESGAGLPLAAVRAVGGRIWVNGSDVHRVDEPAPEPLPPCPDPRTVDEPAPPDGL